MPSVRFLILVALATLAAPASSAQPVLDWLTRADGMPSDYVLAIHQDRWGFIWLATDAGAVRYDGRRFATSSVDDGLPHPYVKGFAETADGTLWAGTNAGLARRTADGWEAADSPLGAEPLLVSTDAEGRLIVRNMSGVARRDAGGWRTAWSPTGFGIGAAPVLDLGDGRLLVSGLRQPAALVLTPEGPDRFAVNAWPVVGEGPLAEMPLSVYRVNNELVAVATHRARWIAPLRLNDARRQLVAGPVRRLPSAIGALAANGGEAVGYGDRWIRSLDVATGDVGPVLHAGHVTDAMYDLEGGLWFGTFGHGVARLRSTHLATLTARPLRRLVLADDQVWAVGDQGFAHADLTGREPPHQIPQSGPRTISRMPDGRFRVGAQATLWVPLSEADMHRFDGAEATALDPGWISGAVETADTLWLGTYAQGVRRFAKTRGGLSEIDTVSVAQGLPTETVEDVERTSAGTWAVTRNGLGLLSGARARALGTAQGLPSSAVFSLYEARDGSHWAGTDQGVARLDLASWRSEAVGTDVMAGHPVVAFFEREDEAGVVWAVTTRALWRIARDSAGWHARLADGFPLVRDRRQTIEDAVYHAASDRLVLATSAGLVTAALSRLAVSDALPPPVAIVGARVNDGAVAVTGTPLAAQIPDLPPGSHRVEIEVAALRYGGTARLEWRQPDGEWREVVDGHVTLSDVDAGDYALVVRAVAPDGVASDVPATLMFSVQPHWWERQLVRALGALLGLAALIGGVRYVSQRRLRHRVVELEVEARVHAERERLARDLHDHVGAEVAAILTEAEAARLEAAAEGRDAGALHVVEQRARRTMGSLREAIWALGLGALTPATLAERLEVFAQTQARRAGLGVDSQATGDTHRALTPDQALALYRIGQEAIRNAVRHSGASRLHITVEAGRGRVAVIVRDDGVFEGISGDGGGNGLANMRARAEALGGHFRLTNGEGTTVYAEFPA